MVHARELTVPAGGRFDVVDFEPPDLLLLPPSAHRLEICRARAMRRGGRPLRPARPAALAAVAVAALRGAARDRPPMVRPERIAAAVAAPRPAPSRQLRRAPRACALATRRRERTHREQRVAFERRGEFHGPFAGDVNATTRSFANLTDHENRAPWSYAHSAIRSKSAAVAYPLG